MSRYAAVAGIRDIEATDSNDANIAKATPFILIVGPSGNVVTVSPPSGVAGTLQEFASEFQGWEHTYDHTTLEWFRNEIVTSWRNTQGTLDTDWGFAWQPYGQPSGGPKVNDLLYDFENNVPLRNIVAFDGFNWKVILPPLGGNKQMWSFKRIPGGGTFWTGFHVAGYEVPANYGVYTGKDPIRTGDKGGAGAPFGWRPLSGLLGRSPTDVNYSASYDGALGGIVQLGGVASKEANVLTESTVLNDIKEFRGTVYFVTQHGMVGLKIGGKGQFIWSEKLFQDTEIDNTTDASAYTSRLTNNKAGGSKSRSLATHNDNIFMLSNDGKVHRVTPHTVDQIADLTTLGTPWSSGIVGGIMNRVPQPADGPFVGNAFRRCFLTSFNGNLHAFLNFQTNFRLTKGVFDGSNTGRGIFWATSPDGTTWTDRSIDLPASGIVSPSGGAITAGQQTTPHVQNWLSFISPYKFSGFTGPNATPIPEASGQFPAVYGTVGLGGADTAGGVFTAQPSGFRQIDIPLWTSGNLIDPEFTPFDSLKAPLEFNTISGFLFPTFIQYPEGFGFQSVSGGPLLFLPSGVGPSGFDYTGCNNYHISGYVDTQKRALQLHFSEDFEDGGSIFFELNRDLEWSRRNYIPFSKQLNGYVPVMLYDPEVIIPSGHVLNPNPSIDEVSKTLTLKYKLYDWPFWNKVDVVSEYSLDYGKSWSFIRRQKQLSTGTLQSDPSGVIGTEHSLIWKWSDKDDSPHPISKNVWQPHMQIRLRAVDPNFNPSGVG